VPTLEPPPPRPAPGRAPALPPPPPPLRLGLREERLERWLRREERWEPPASRRRRAASCRSVAASVTASACGLLNGSSSPVLRILSIRAAAHTSKTTRRSEQTPCDSCKSRETEGFVRLAPAMRARTSKSALGGSTAPVLAASCGLGRGETDPCPGPTDLWRGEPGRCLFARDSSAGSQYSSRVGCRHAHARFRPEQRTGRGGCRKTCAISYGARS
jgi:hypothetical protein